MQWLVLFRIHGGFVHRVCEFANLSQVFKFVRSTLSSFPDFEFLGVYRFPIDKDALDYIFEQLNRNISD